MTAFRSSRGRMPRHRRSMTDTTNDLSVLIAGGGLGGLALAAGLRLRGIRTRVIERDTDLTATGGYHIHLDGSALRALRDLLDRSAFESLLAASATTRVQNGDVMRDMRGRLLLRTRPGDDGGGVNIDRITLRLLLADSAGDALRAGRAVTGHTRDGAEVVVELDDGSTERHDLLVGAEGVHSAVARSLAGGPTSTPAGLLGIGGRTPAEGVGPAARRLLGRDAGLAIGPGGTGLYVGHHDPVGDAVLARGAGTGAADPSPVYV